MSVISYLTSRASAAVLSSAETASINTSISTLASRLDGYFTQADNGLREKLRFGSSTRGTILPRRLDAHSDIDYMIVFQKGGYKPQTYLDRLKTFVEKRYASSDIKQSSPTIILELDHIKFDLVPALFSYGSTYQIPNGPNDWQFTDPTGFNKVLTDKNNSELSMIKPTIRLAKIWNAANGYVFDSYEFERSICSTSFAWASNQRDYLFTVFDNLSTYHSAQWRNERITRAKEIVQKVRQLERDSMPYSAEAEVKRLIPE